MEKINLFLMDMSEGGTISGVTRYLETLMRGLSSCEDIEVCWIRFIHSRTQLLHRLESVAGHKEYIVPLPLSMNLIINESFWNQKYNEVVFYIIRHLFEGKKRILIHIHTLNLINMALFIKSNINCKIITHLHCIPWKGLYNHNLEHFNYLYEMASMTSFSDTNHEMILNDWEYNSYTKADRLICVTQCGADFVRKEVKEKLPPIDVITNGMDDFYSKEDNNHKKSKYIRLLYVGTLSPSKGLSFILEALGGVKRRGYEVQLQVAGGGYLHLVGPLLSKYQDLNIKMLGLLPFEQLKEVYENSDIGVIASLQEQASYVAIEMAMFRLAIITTAVDGLDEMFVDEVTALKVNTIFTKEKGLEVDVKMLEDKIVELIENKNKRLRLQRNARRMYMQKMALEQMINSTVEVYHQLV